MDKLVKKCFIIMPFGSSDNPQEQLYWDNHYENFLKKFLVEHFPNLEVKRSEPSGESLLDKILINITHNDLLIADISNLNPNVIWELGVRHSFKHGTIIIAKKGTKLPSDLKDVGVLFYDFSQHPYSSEINEFFKKFTDAIKNCLNNPNRKDSPVLEAIPRGSFFEIVKKQENIRKITAIIKECDDNINTLKNALDAAKSNQNQFNKKITPCILISRLRSSAIELLVVTRYIGEGEIFYNDASNLLLTTIKTNDQLVSWDYEISCSYEKNLDSTEQWLIENLPRIIIRIKKFKVALIKIQKKMSDQC